MKFRDKINPNFEEREIIGNFMNILSLHKLIGNFSIKEEEM